MNPLLNLAAFNLLWAAIVLGAAHGLDAAGIGALLAWLPVHLWLSRTRGADAALFAALALLGPVVDATLMHSQLIGFKGWTPHPALPPLWLAALWGNFALAVNHSLAPLLRRPLFAGAFGALGGPLAYYLGARLGAATLPVPMSDTLLVLALTWAVLAPVIGLVALAHMPKARGTR